MYVAEIVIHVMHKIGNNISLCDMITYAVWNCENIDSSINSTRGSNTTQKPIYMYALYNIHLFSSFLHALLY